MRINYYGIWKIFNKFIVHLDKKPNSWEQHITLFVAHLIDQNRKASTVKSYVSAIKAILSLIDVEVHEDTCLLNSLMRACKLTNTSVHTQLPIQRDLLNLLLQSTSHQFMAEGQPYLAHMYSALISTRYFGLFRIGELTDSPHTIKAVDVHIAQNKRKILFVLRSSKTHNKGDQPQLIKITSCSTKEEVKYSRKGLAAERTVTQHCPYDLICNYLNCRKGYLSNNKNFFVFRDRSAVLPRHFNNVLKHMLQLA